MIKELFGGLNERGVSPVIAIVLLLMMTVAAAGAAYFWLTQMQSSVQEQSTESIENIVSQSGRRLVAQAAICEPTAPDGMVGWWEFYEGEGNKTHDSSENENIGTLYDANSSNADGDTLPQWTDGKAGKALDFDGSDDYVDVPNLGLSGDPSFTISAWVKISNNSVSSPIYYQGDGTVNNKIYWFYNPLKPGWMISFHGNDLWWTTIPEEGVWIHIVVVYDAVNSKRYIYKNGDLKASDGPENPSILDNDNLIGKQAGTTTVMDGTIDEVRIYDRALSAEEINETYKGKMKVKMTVRNIGSVEVPEAKFVANLKKDGTTVDSDTYTTTSSIDTGDLNTLTFYFNEMRPGGEKYTISIPGIDVSQTVKCQSLE